MLSIRDARLTVLALVDAFRQVRAETRFRPALDDTRYDCLSRRVRCYDDRSVGSPVRLTADRVILRDSKSSAAASRERFGGRNPVSQTRTLTLSLAI